MLGSCEALQTPLFAAGIAGGSQVQGFSACCMKGQVHPVVVFDIASRRWLV